MNIPKALKDIVYQCGDSDDYINLRRINRSFYIDSCRKNAVQTIKIKGIQCTGLKVLLTRFHSPQQLIINGSAWSLLPTLNKLSLQKLQYLHLNQLYESNAQLIKLINSSRFIQCAKHFTTNVTISITISFKSIQIYGLFGIIPRLFELFLINSNVKKFIIHIDIQIIHQNNRLEVLVTLIQNIQRHLQAYNSKYKSLIKCCVSFKTYDLIHLNKAKLFQGLTYKSINSSTTVCSNHGNEISHVTINI